MLWRRRWTRWHEEGGGRELLRLAWPLILSNSCLTLQMAIDRIFLSQRLDQDAVGAAMASIMLFWLTSQNT